MRPGRARDAEPDRRRRHGDDGAPIEGVVISPDAYSQGEVLRHREFDRMTPAELRDAERLIDLLGPRLERGGRAATSSTRTAGGWRRGRCSGATSRPAATSSTGSGGGQIREPRTLVVLCDISGSMERHARLLLRFVQALSAASEVRTESFVFGTRLTRVTRLLRERDRDRALARVAETVTDWSGGTRIGESFRTFNLRWARRSLRTSGVVIVVSDGWDRGDPALVASETARLQRNCHRLIWLNPLAGAPGYQPLAGGMRPPIRTSTTSCRPGRWPRSSGSARSWAASGRATRGGAARRPPTPRCPVRSGRRSPRCRPSSAVRPSTRSAPRPLR